MGQALENNKLLDVSYEFSEATVESLPYTLFDLKMALGFEAGVYLCKNFEEKNYIITERGKWCFKHYPLEKYDYTGVPDLTERTDLETLMETITSDMADIIYDAF